MTKLLTDIYDIVHKNMRGKAEEGFIRPTIAQFFTGKAFQEIHRNITAVANPDSATCDENTNILINLLANDTDLEGDLLTVISVSSPAHGTLINHNNGTVTYTPTAYYFGIDSFNYTISDGEFTSSNIVSITVNEINYGPVATSKNMTVNENSYIDINLLDGATDVDDDTLTVTNVTTPGHGTVYNRGNGIYRYTPTSGYYGADSFNFTISDGELISTNVVLVTINNTNTPPVANPDTASCDEDSSVLINLLANDTDVDNDSLTITNLTTPSHGTLINHNNGTVTYTPTASYYGSDSFNYTISDGEVTRTSTASITINQGIVLPQTWNGTIFPTAATYPFTKGGTGSPYLTGGALHTVLDSGTATYYRTVPSASSANGLTVKFEVRTDQDPGNWGRANCAISTSWGTTESSNLGLVIIAGGIYNWAGNDESVNYKLMNCTIFNKFLWQISASSWKLFANNSSTPIISVTHNSGWTDKLQFGDYSSHNTGGCYSEWKSVSAGAGILDWNDF